MGRVTHWRQAPGHLVVEVVLDNYGKWADADTGELLPRELAAWLDDAYPAEEPDGFGVSLTIEFTSDGYSDPGVWGGPPDNWSPPEGEDIREITQVFAAASPENVVLPAELHPAVWQAWGDDIGKAEIDVTPDYPDYPEYPDEA